MIDSADSRGCWQQGPIYTIIQPFHKSLMTLCLGFTSLHNIITCYLSAMFRSYNPYLCLALIVAPAWRYAVAPLHFTAPHRYTEILYDTQIGIRNSEFGISYRDSSFRYKRCFRVLSISETCTPLKE